MMSYRQPEWITEPLSPNDIAAINQGGCDSGAYMPAVSYYAARQTMAEHGDDVLDYLEGMMGELPKPPDDCSWSGMSCFYLSRAVELHCAVYSDLEDWEDEEAIAA
jgi:hypothetical protein